METKRVVVILVGHDGVIPSLQHAIHLFRDWEHSIQTYWRDAAGGVVDLSFTFFGPYPISVPAIARNADGACPRSLVIDRARTAAQDSGVELGGYDATVVMMHPAVHTTINGETFRYDVGSSGTRCLLPVWEDFTYFCHEVGHTIGFDHSYGIPNTGADWDGALNGWMFSPVYGDPYDLMSSASFGGATSSFNLPTAAMGYAGSQRGGPLLARAQLHFAKAAHYDATGRTVHQNESATQAVDLVPAGSVRQDAPSCSSGTPMERAVTAPAASTSNCAPPPIDQMRRSGTARSTRRVLRGVGSWSTSSRRPQAPPPRSGTAPG